MPIFMDRHDVSVEVTAESVAQLHQEDLKIENQFGCRSLTYWFDGKRKMAFCLIEAPRKETVVELHEKAHGAIPSQIIEVDPRIVESFLRRIEDPQKDTGTSLNIITDSPFRIVMLINFNWNSFVHIGTPVENLEKEISECISLFHGSVVKERWDGFLISFTSAVKAVNAALYIRNSSTKKTGNNTNEGKFKISLSAGIPVTDKRHIFEESIRTAERCCRVVDGEVIISSMVRDLYDAESAHPVTKNKDVRSISAADEIFLNHLLEFMELQWSNANLKVDDLTKPTTCSKSRLYRHLKSLTGNSPNEFISQYRLEEAVKILHNSEKTVAEVAFETGFTSPSYFTKCFHKRYGYLPSDHLHRRVTS